MVVVDSSATPEINSTRWTWRGLLRSERLAAHSRHQVIMSTCCARAMVWYALNMMVIEEIFYVWNPSTELFKQLPDPPVLSKPYEVIYHGCRYLSATDDYKFLVARIEEEEEEELEEEEKKVEVDIFSRRAQVWKRNQVPKEDSITREGILLNETLHWLGEGGKKDTKDILFAFDFAKEEFRKMPLPILDEGGKLFRGITVSLGGCLCLYRFFTAEHCAKYFAEYSSSIDMWVMRSREYDVGDSWIKLCRLKFSNIPKYLTGFGISNPSWLWKIVQLWGNGLAPSTLISG